MKKLYFAGAGIVLLLLFSIWAKNANFNLSTMMETTFKPVGTPSATLNSSLSKATPTIPVEILITVTPYGFVPSVITISPGTKITWVNKSGTNANVSSDTHPTHKIYPALNLGNFGMNSSVSLIFTQVGRFGYHNDVNPAQHGTIVVR